MTGLDIIEGLEIIFDGKYKGGEMKFGKPNEETIPLVNNSMGIIAEELSNRYVEKVEELERENKLLKHELEELKHLYSKEILVLSSKDKERMKMGRRKHKQDKYKTYQASDQLEKNRTKRKEKEANRLRRLTEYKTRKTKGE